MPETRWDIWEPSDDSSSTSVPAGAAPPDGEDGASEGDSSIMANALRAARPSWRGVGLSLTGTALAGGRILVGRRLGGGAMGTVYEATDDGNPVAIKVLNRVEEHDVYRLKTEFRTLKDLRHPNVLSVYELFSEQGTWFFTMERIDGVPIHRYVDSKVERYDRVDVVQARIDAVCPLFFQLLQGVDSIHAAGLVHRDLKPTNILVSDHERVVIIDFGLVSEQRQGGVGQTIDNRVSGTFGYMSPEQARGGTATAASDCHALGAILRQLVTGRASQSASHRSHAQPSSEFAQPSHSRSVKSLLALSERLVSTKPDDRPSAPELLAVCGEWALGGGAALSPSRPPQGAETCVGRASELERLCELHRAVLEGSAKVAFIHGPCGIGKSLLLKRLIDELALRDVVVLDGRCSEWESVPYKGLDGVIDKLSRLLLRLSADEVGYLVPRHVAAVLQVFPTLGRVPALLDATKAAGSVEEPAYTLRRRAMAGLRDLFYRLSERRKVVVSIEDLQWTDAETLQVVVELLSPPDEAPIYWLITARAEGESLSELIGSIAKVASVESVELGPLDRAESAHLAKQSLLIGRDDPELIDRIVSESQGVPQQIVEFASELGVAPAHDRLRRLADALLARIDRLSPSRREVLELVATAVRPLTMRIAGACGITDAQAAVHDLMSQNLLRSVALRKGERGFDTYTEHVRRIVLHAMPEQRTVERHRALVQALEPIADVAPEWLLAHYRGAGCHEKAKQYCLIAADAALKLLAHNHAANMFLAALELTHESAPDWVALNVRCAEALTKAGRGTEAARTFVRAARASPEDRQLPLLSMAVEQWIRSGHVDEGVALLRQTLESVGIAWPKSAAAAIVQLVSRRIVVRLRGLSCDVRPESETPLQLLRMLDALRPAQTVLGTYDYLRGAAFSTMALPLALKAREPKRLIVALASEAVFAAMLGGLEGQGRIDTVQQHLDRLEDHAQSPVERAAPTLVRAMCAYWMGYWLEVTDLALQAESLLRENVVGTLWESSLLRSVRHTVMLHSGHFDALAIDLPDALAQAAMYEDRYTQLDLLRRTASCHLIRDEAKEAEEVAAEIGNLRSKYGIVAMDHLIMSLVVSIHLYTGNVPRARSELDARWKSCEKQGMGRFPLVRTSVVGMRADCVACDERLSEGERAKTLRRLAGVAADQPIAWAPALHHALLGRALALDGSHSKAYGEFVRASREFSTLGLTAASARAEWLAANLRAKSDSPSALRAARDPEKWARIVHSLY